MKSLSRRQYNTSMRSRRLAFLLASLILIISGGIIYLWGTPTLKSVYPQPGAEFLPAGTALRLTFSRPMRADAVLERLTLEPSVAGEYTWEGNTLIFTPGGPWPNGQTVNVHLASGARADGLLSFPLQGDQAWYFTIGEPRLAYLFPADASADLYLLNLQSGEIEQLTDSPGTVLDYDIDLTGANLYYASSQGDGGSTLHHLNLQTGESTPLLDCPQALCRYPRVSPSGNYLVYERTNLSGDEPLDIPQVWLLPFSPSPGNQDLNASQPYLADDPDQQTQQPFWSLTGLLTYYNYSLVSFVVQDLETGQRIQFPSQTGFPGDWSPTGAELIFPEIFVAAVDPETVTDLESIPISHILRFSYPDGEQYDLSKENAVEDASPVFSPDGQQVAFGRKYLDIARWTPGRQLWVMDADGESARPLTQEPNYNHYDFAWSPSGGTLAYTRFNKDALTEPPEIWLVNADGTGATRLITGGYAPQWTP